MAWAGAPDGATGEVDAGAAQEQGAEVFPGRGLWRAGRRRRGGAREPLPGDEQPAVDVARSEQAVVTEVDESVGQDVLQEAAQELDRVQGGGLVSARAEGDGVGGLR